jgi:hypothetical protein
MYRCWSSIDHLHTCWSLSSSLATFQSSHQEPLSFSRLTSPSAVFVPLFVATLKSATHTTFCTTCCCSRGMATDESFKLIKWSRMCHPSLPWWWSSRDMRFNERKVSKWVVVRLLQKRKGALFRVALARLLSESWNHRSDSSSWALTFHGYWKRSHLCMQDILTPISKQLIKYCS